MNCSLIYLQKPFKIDSDKSDFHPTDSFKFLNSIIHKQICVTKFPLCLDRN